MSGKSDFLEAAILALLFKGSPIANIADNAVSGPLTNLYVALHSSDPTDAGNQSSNEVAYTGYARVAVPRSALGFAVTGTAPTKSSPVNPIDFPACSGGTATATHWSIGVASSGGTTMLYSGTITNPISISTGVTPQLTAASMVTED